MCDKRMAVGREEVYWSWQLNVQLTVWTRHREKGVTNPQSSIVV